MALDARESSASPSEGPIQLIDLTEEEQEAPFAVREADEYVDAVPGRIPDKAEVLAWLEQHPVVVGIATGVLCFSIIAGAMTAVLGPESDDDDPVAGAALSETDGSQGSFSSSGSGAANFTSDESKLSRSGAGKVLDDPGDGESAAGPTNSAGNPNSPTARGTQSSNPTTDATPNLDQSATVNGPNRAPQAGGDGSSNPAGPAATGSTVTTLNPGPNVSGTIPTTPTTTRVSTSTPVSNPTTTPTSGQTASTATAPTTVPTTPSTAPTTATTPTTSSTSTTTPPVSISIAAPGSGTSHSFETPTNFAANFVSGATEYCWAFIQGGSTALTACSGSTTYQLPARPSQLNPGLVTVRVTATGPFGSVADTIQISLYRTKVINNPTGDVTIGRGALRVGVVNLVGATQYCFRLTQTGYDSGSLCYSTPGKTFNKNDPIWDSLSPGPLTVSASVYGGGTLLAADMVTIQLL